MEKMLLLELQQNQKRLEYYHRLKGQVKSGASGESSTDSIEKWIGIYSERIQKLESRQTTGLKVDLKNLRVEDLENPDAQEKSPRKATASLNRSR